MPATLFDALPGFGLPTLMIAPASELEPASVGGGGGSDSDIDEELRSALATRANLAEELGESEDRIRIVRPDWGTLTRRVIAVTLHVGYYRARRALTHEDVGLSSTMRQDPTYASTLHEVVHFGNKLLLPNEIRAFERCESQARYELEQVSLRSSFGFLVRREAYQGLRDRLSAIREEFFGLRDGLLDRYDELAVQILCRFRIIGRGALAHLQSSGAEIEDEDQWIEDYAQRHVALLPPREHIFASFSFEWVPTYLAASSALVEDEALAEQRRMECAVETELERMKLQNIRYQEDFDYQKKQMELQTLRRERECEEQLAREIADARVRKETEWIDGTLKEVSTQLRELIYDACLDTLTGMRKTGRVGRNSSKQLGSLVKRLQTLNVLDDAEIASITRQMDAIVRSDARRRDQGTIQDVLTEIGTLARAQLLAAGRSPRSGLAVDIPDVVPMERTTRARRGGLSAVSFEVPVMIRRSRRGVSCQAELLAQ